MCALALTLCLLGAEPSPGAGIMDRLEVRSQRLEEAADRHSGALVTAAKRIYWGIVILGCLYLSGKFLDIVKVIVTARYSKG